MNMTAPRLTLVEPDEEPHRNVTPAATRVLIADGQALVRAGLRALLERTGTIVVAGEATNGEDAVALARRVCPDVVLIDASLPGLDCLEAARRMLADSGVAVMLLTSCAEDGRVFAAMRAGVSGLVHKDAPPEDLVRAVEAVARGDALLSSGHARELIADLVARPEPDAPSAALLEELTAREREVVTLVAAGLSNAKIAQRLVVSLSTAKTHVSRSMVKLHARSRAQLVVFAYESGLAQRQGR
jgi:DNA-binding NarL/FixJ family response regulator